MASASIVLAFIDIWSCSVDADVFLQLGGGLWHPEARALAALRQDIDQNPRRLKDVLMADGIRKELLNDAPRKLEKVVQAFVSSATNAETALKTKPKVSKHTRVLPA